MSVENESGTEKYVYLIQENEEASKELLPIKSKSKKKEVTADSGTSHKCTKKSKKATSTTRLLILSIQLHEIGRNSSIQLHEIGRNSSIQLHEIGRNSNNVKASSKKHMTLFQKKN